jgi:1-acyl-sn-glycerol-3-phosphate acyltransferase
MSRDDLKLGNLLRSLAFNVAYFGLTTALAAYGTVACRSGPRALALGKLWARLSMATARRIAGIQLEVTGWEHLPQSGPALIACQHQSAFDTMVWLALLPHAAYVMKWELAKIPLFGPLTVRAGMIPVNREGGAATLRGLMRAAQRAAANGQQIVIFPEGTRTVPGVFVELHDGIAAVAASTRLPVCPALTDSGRVWGRRSFRKYPGVIHLDILPPLPAGLKRAELMDRLRALLQPVENSVGSAATDLPRRDNPVSQFADI